MKLIITVTITDPDTVEACDGVDPEIMADDFRDNPKTFPFDEVVVRFEDTDRFPDGDIMYLS